MALVVGISAFFACVCISSSSVVKSPTFFSQQDLFLNITKAEPLYEEFLRTFGLKSSRAEGDSVARAERQALFAARHEEVQKHNNRHGNLWAATINHFADYTDSERLAVLGHKPGRGSAKFTSMSSAGVGKFAMPKMLQFSAAKHTVASHADWRGLQSSRYLRNQGACGSCWAVAATGVIEMRFEVENDGKTQHLSHAHIVDCMPNPQRCGGNGGCDGATAELAFDYVQHHGIASLDNFRGSCEQPDAPVSVGGYIRLPENEAVPMMEALSDSGPVVGSVDATTWFNYDQGVFNSCSKNAVVNHAIIIMGYGHDSSLDADYWLIRNSWGPNWGELGYMRLLRHGDGSAWCGIDYRPEEGNGCIGGPTQIPVCGMCGILSDSSYPIGVKEAHSGGKHEEFAKHVQPRRNLRSVTPKF